MDEALEILKKYDELGVREVWFTPHIMEDIPNTTQHLKERFAELQAAYKGNVILHLAAENMLDSLFEERLEKNDLLPIGKKGNHLLVETSCYNPPVGLQNILLRIKSKGYYPILAHPERYLYMGKKDYSLLKEARIEFQLNLFSLFGLYGKDIQKKARKLLSIGYFDCFGTDLHRWVILTDSIKKNIIDRKEIDKMAHELLQYNG